MDLEPGSPVNVTIPTGPGVYSVRAYDYLLSVKASDGFVPYITEPGSKDRRYLGVLMQLKAKTRIGRFVAICRFGDLATALSPKP